MVNGDDKASYGPTWQRITMIKDVRGDADNVDVYPFVVGIQKGTGS